MSEFVLIYVNVIVSHAIPCIGLGYMYTNSTLSGHKTCISGIPQGSVLSPLLFITFINDLPDFLKNSPILLYADATKFLKPFNCRLDCFLLQQDLDAFAAWCPTWQVK